MVMKWATELRISEEHWP